MLPNLTYINLIPWIAPMTCPITLINKMNGGDYFEFSTKCLDFGGLILKFLVVSKRKILNFWQTNTAVFSSYVKRKITCYINIFLDMRMRNDKLLETYIHKVERLRFELTSDTNNFGISNSWTRICGCYIIIY
jgi:uncharacterized membrane protein